MTTDSDTPRRFPTATPGPWTVDTTEHGGWAVVVDADSAGAKVIADLDDTYGDRAANAAIIVHAVNAFREAEPVAEHECLMPSACGEVGFYCANYNEAVDRARLAAQQEARTDDR